MMIAKIIFFGLLTLKLGMRLVSHGDERPPENGWIAFIGYVLTLGLLYWAGFFDNC